MSLEKMLSKSSYKKLQGNFQSPQSGKLKGRTEHTYDKDSFKGHKYTKKFGGAGYEGQRPTSKHHLNLALKKKMK